MKFSLFFFLISLLVFTPATIALNSTLLPSCASYKFSNGKQFSSCHDLPNNASLYWNYHASSSSSSSKTKDTVIVDVAYRRSSLTERRWVAWAVNPSGTRMVGCQALVAIPRADGSVNAYTSPVTSYGTSLQPGKLSFPAYDISATHENNEITIFATLQLPLATDNNITSHVVAHVWQDGPLKGDTPMAHDLSPKSPNMRSFGTLDFFSGKSVSSTSNAITRRTQIKYAHSVVNVVSWGLMMPIGVIVARYMKEAGPVWFYLHMACQVVGSAVAIAGFSTGVYMAARYGVVSTMARAHMGVGVALVVLVASQVGVGVFARPKPESKKRKYFNWFHYVVGYSTILLSAGNVFLGFRILETSRIWMDVYIGVVGFIGIVALVLEICQRFRFFKGADNVVALPIDLVC